MPKQSLRERRLGISFCCCNSLLMFPYWFIIKQTICFSILRTTFTGGWLWLLDQLVIKPAASRGWSEAALASGSWSEALPHEALAERHAAPWASMHWRQSNSTQRPHTTVGSAKHSTHCGGGGLTSVVTSGSCRSNLCGSGPCRSSFCGSDVLGFPFSVAIRC